MSRPQRPDDDRRIELWTRQLDGQPLNAAETADLVRALVDDTELRGVFDLDDRLHGLLSASAKLGRSPQSAEPQRSRESKLHDEERFIAGVFAKLDRVAPQEVIPLDTVAVAPVSGLAIEPSGDTSTNSAIDAQGAFSFVVPVDGHRRNTGRSHSRSSASWWNGGTLKWATAAAVALLCAVGFAVVLRMANKGGERPEGQPVAADSRGLPAKSTGDRRERDIATAPPASQGSAGPFDAITERAGGAAERNPDGKNRLARPAANGVDVQPVDVQPVVWRTGGPSGGRLLPGVHELAHGRARVRTADDLELDVAAPAMLELRDPRSVDVRRGVVRVHDPELRVTTPFTELRSLDGDAEFRVAEAGETEIVIHDGELTFAERLSGAGAAQPITLQAGRLDHARLSAPRANAPAASAREPRGDEGRVAVAELTGPGAQFRGVINVDGRVLEFNSPAAFDAARRQTFSQFQRSPEEFIERWKQMVQEMNSRFGSDGSFIELNGRRLEPRSGDAAFGFQFSSQSSSSSGAGANESFRGSININGRQHTFNSRAEFEAAQRELLKPAAKP